MVKNSRRDFLKKTLAGGMFGYAALVQGAYVRFNLTPAEVEGPFYPIFPQKDKDFDLTHVEGKPGMAKGKVIWIEGLVVDAVGAPLEDVSVDIWHANAAGRYRHPRDKNIAAPVDPNFQGWAIVQTGKAGQFRFKTIMPGPYPASKEWMRPPHIHFKVSKRGYHVLTTQMYFPGHPLNDTDLLLQQKAPNQQKFMIASRISLNPETYRYQIVLQSA